MILETRRAASKDLKAKRQRNDVKQNSLLTLQKSDHFISISGFSACWQFIKMRFELIIHGFRSLLTLKSHFVQPFHFNLCESMYWWNLEYAYRITRRRGVISLIRNVPIGARKLAADISADH